MARREVGALTRALQRCLPRRMVTLGVFLDFDLAAAGGLLEGGLGSVVKSVILDAVRGCTQKSEYAKQIEWE